VEQSRQGGRSSLNQGRHDNSIPILSGTNFIQNFVFHPFNLRADDKPTVPFVPGTNFDQIQVGGATTLGGALTVQLVNSFVPTLNQSFQILTSVGSVSGTFTSLNLPSPGAGKAWQVQYGTNDVKLVIVAAGSAASISTNGTSSAGSGSHSGGALGPGPSVPEPSTLTILLLGCIPLKLVRRAGKRHISRRLLPCHA